MSDDRIFCSFCNAFTEHVTIKSGNECLVRCQICENVHSIEPERTRLASLGVIISRGDTSRRYQITLPADEVLRKGEELLVDDDIQDVVVAEITSIETGRRVDKARADEIKTLWARAVDEVDMKVSVHKGGTTRSVVLRTDGNEVISVGDIRSLDKRRFQVEKIKLRNGRFVRRAKAKYVLRAWGAQL